MSQPSVILAAIKTRLQTLLGSGVSVLTTDGSFEGKDYKTTAPATVLLACLRLPIDPEYDYDPPTASAEFAAFVIVKKSEALKKQSDVCMDLAGLVVSHLSRETFSGCIRRADKIRSDNQYSQALKQDGVSVWIIRWTQPFELTPADTDGILNRLAEIRTTYDLAPDTTDISTILEFAE